MKLTSKAKTRIAGSLIGTTLFVALWIYTGEAGRTIIIGLLVLGLYANGMHIDLNKRPEEWFRD